MDHTLITSPIPRLEDIAVRLIDTPETIEPDIIDGLLPRKGALVIAGETNIGKTLLALEVCSSLSSGEPLWGQLQPRMQAKKILYVLAEHYAGIVQNLWRVTKLPMTDTTFLLAPEHMSKLGDGNGQFLVVRGNRNQSAIEALKFWAQGCDLIVFDPLAAMINGVDAENDNLQMRMLLNVITDIAIENGAACIVLAHQGKPMMDQKGQEQRRKSYAIRGASAIEDAATNIFYFGAAGTMEIEGTTLRAYELTLRKYKGIAPESYSLYRDKTTLVHGLAKTSGPFVTARKADLRAKIQRIQEYHRKFDYDTALSIVAVCEGISVTTAKRWLGLTEDEVRLDWPPGAVV